MTPEQRQFGVQLLSALAHPARMRIVEYLAAGPASVKDIMEAVGLKQSITSQHLAALLTAGVLVRSASGNQRIYRLRGPRLARLLELVEEFYEVHLESLREVLAQHADTGPGSRSTDRPGPGGRAGA